VPVFENLASDLLLRGGEDIAGNGIFTQLPLHLGAPSSTGSFHSEERAHIGRLVLGSAHLSGGYIFAVLMVSFVEAPGRSPVPSNHLVLPVLRRLRLNNHSLVVIMTQGFFSVPFSP
jgi:hypothetical protein